MGMSDIQKRALKGGTALSEDSELPIRVPRDVGAELVTHRYFTVSARTLEKWPLAVRRVNGKAHVEVTELFAVAEAMLAEAPPVRGGRRAASQRPAD